MFEIRQSPEFGTILFKNGAQAHCPFSISFPVQGNMGQIQIMSRPCNTNCPLASLAPNPENDEELYYTVYCGCDPVAYPIMKGTEQKEATSAILKPA